VIPPFARRLRVLAASLFLVSMVLPAAAAPAAAVSPNIVISQVYGGGGNSGPRQNDFVELFNQALGRRDGLTVQYASTSGTAWQRTVLAGTNQPGAYFSSRGAGAGEQSICPPQRDRHDRDERRRQGRTGRQLDAASGACPGARRLRRLRQRDELGRDRPRRTCPTRRRRFGTATAPRTRTTTRRTSRSGRRTRATPRRPTRPPPSRARSPPTGRRACRTPPTSRSPSPRP
jgi:hypothetical protein